uniref:uncharacterized protein LOC125416435 n=1 Tax=Myodes glareolus TaxID=447135 RepID=UPI002021EFA6|nr:uncharacterized protein LOC125416435 [Myodes glareolus]
MRRKVVWTPREAHRRQGNYYGHQRGEEFVLGQEGLVYASLPGIHPIRPRVLPSFPIVHVSCSPEGRHLPSVCPHIKCQVARPPRWCVHCTAGRWCRPWWCSRGFPDSKFVFGKGNLPADGMCTPRLACALQTLPYSSEKTKESVDIMCVFLNIERMTALTKKTLQTAWGVHVLDRFTIILHIFCCNAYTRKAWLHLALAEIPLLWRVTPALILRLAKDGYAVGGPQNLHGVFTAPVLTTPVLAAPVLTAPLVTASVLTAAVLTEALLTAAALTTAVFITAVFTSLVLAASVLTSPHLISPHLISPDCSCPHRSCAHCSCPHLTSPALPAAVLTSPALTAAVLTAPVLTAPVHTAPVLNSPIYATLVHITPWFLLPTEPLPHRYSLPGPCILAVSALLGHGLDKLKAMLEESVLQATG